MKTNWTIFFDKGVMKAYETIKVPEIDYYQTKEDQMEEKEKWEDKIEAACLPALPVAEESIERVLINIRLSEKTRTKFAQWECDQTKTYQIETKLQEKTIKLPKTTIRAVHETIIRGGQEIKALVLSSNH